MANKQSGKTTTKQDSTKTKNKGKTASSITKSPKKSMKTKSRKNNKSTSMTPVYVLSIMTLLTIIVILSNYLIDREMGSKIKSNKETKIKIEPVDLAEDNKHTFTEKKSNEKSIEQTTAKLEEDIPEKKIKIYLIKINDHTEKISLVPVTRKIKSNSSIKETVEQLIKGPNNYEKGRGLLTAIPENLRIRNILKKDRTLIIDFNNAIEAGANGDILLHRVDQIVYTATQFADIDSVKIKVNGKYRKALGSDGLSINGPLTRRRM